MEDILYGWACGGNTGSGPGYIYRTTNGGANWVQMNHPASQSAWNQIEKVGSSIWFIGVYSGTPNNFLIMKTSDDGITWDLTSYSQFDASYIYAFDSLNFLVYADEGLLARTSDGGNSWISSNLPSDYQVQKIVFNDTYIGYALVSQLWPNPSDAYLYRTTDGGFTWSQYYSWIDQGQKVGLSVIPGTGIIFVGGWLSATPPYLFGMLKSTDGGNSWTVVMTGTFGVEKIYTPNTYNGWATAGGSVYRYDYVTPPTIEPISNKLVQFGEAFTYQVNATGMGLEYSMTGNPQGLNIGTYSGLIDGIPTQGGKFDITVAVQDTDANYVNEEFRLKVNRVPHFMPPFPPTHCWVDSNYQVTLQVEDADDDTVTFSWLTKPNWLVFLTEGITNMVLQGVPSVNDTGFHPVSVLVNDGYGGLDTLNWTIQVEVYVPVNHAPYFVPPFPDTLAYVDSLYDIMLYAEDIDDDSLDFAFLQKPTWLLMLESMETSRIQGIPSIADTGYHSVSVTVSDYKGGADTLSWVIHVRYRSSLTVNLMTSWNLVSVPLWTESNLLLDLYPSAQGSAYGFNGSSYQQTNTLEQGVGYWAKFPTDTAHVISGWPMATIVVDVHEGWNIIGSVDHTCYSPAGEMIISQMWGYQGVYAPESTLVPGRAYWVKTDVAGQIILGNDSTYQAPQLSQPTAILTVSDNDNHTQSLNLFRDTVDLEWYSVPPLPPDGGFDVRFQSQRLAEVIPQGSDSSYQLLVRNDQYPISFLWQPDTTIANAFLVIDGNNHQLTPGEYIEIDTPFSQATLHITIVTSVEPVPGNIPTSYELYQNYPNPFNPVTVIRYELPQSTEVSLTVYNLLGQEVVVLVNEYQSVGIYQVDFNGQSLPSGAYFYRLQAGKFIQTKKMVLLK